jgi:AraC-like DNA-binding protein
MRRPSSRAQRRLQAHEDEERAEAARRELVELLGRRIRADGGQETAIPSLNLYRFSTITEPAHALQQPGVYVVVQGRKQVTVGDATYFYDPSQYLAVSLELPAVGRVVQATPEQPYLCMTLAVDERELGALLLEAGGNVPRDDHDGRAVFVSPVRAPLLDGFLRLVRLLDSPNDIPVLAPLILREINYRLLQEEQSGRLAAIALGHSRLRRVAGAVRWIKEHFAERLEIDALAKRVNMSPSSFHAHFKAVTMMSPVQYQKRLRLQEARRLLVAGESSEVVAYQVGYASPSQFTREYARLFGQPPRRDAERVRDAVTRRQQ